MARERTGTRAAHCDTHGCGQPEGVQGSPVSLTQAFTQLGPLQASSSPKPASSAYLSKPSQRPLLPALLLAHSVKCRPQRSLALTGPEGMLNALEIVYLMAITALAREARQGQVLGSHRIGG